MHLNEIAFVVWIGAGFICLLGLCFLFETVMVNLFDSKRKASTPFNVKTSVLMTLTWLGVFLAAWVLYELLAGFTPQFAQNANLAKAIKSLQY